MSEKNITGPIFSTKDRFAKYGEAFTIRSKTGQGWGLPLDDVTPNDLRKLADYIENLETLKKVKDVSNLFR